MERTMARETMTYEVQLSRMIREYMTVTVVAASPAAARRRALRIERYDVDVADGEERPDWTDAEILSRRVKVESVREQ